MSLWKVTFIHKRFLPNLESKSSPVLWNTDDLVGITHYDIISVRTMAVYYIDVTMILEEANWTFSNTSKGHNWFVIHFALIKLNDD